MIFEVGKEYWISYGTVDDQYLAWIKVIEVDGTWLKVESDKLEPLINISAPLYISAKERDRAAEEDNKFYSASAGRRLEVGDYGI